MCGDSKNLNFNRGIIEELILRIDDEIREELTIDYLASIIGYSTGHLRRLFKSYVGISLAAYVRKRKVEFAAREIIKCSGLIVEISTEYSFSSQSSFCRAFKSVVGVTPTEYRS